MLFMLFKSFVMCWLGVVQFQNSCQSLIQTSCILHHGDALPGFVDLAMSCMRVSQDR